MGNEQVRTLKVAGSEIVISKHYFKWLQLSAAKL